VLTVCMYPPGEHVVLTVCMYPPGEHVVLTVSVDVKPVPRYTLVILQCTADNIPNALFIRTFVELLMVWTC
jgi:hypothetical protein